MTVKDLFLCCDRQTLKAEFMGMEDVSATEEITERIFETLEKTEPVLSGNDVILGTEFVDVIEGLPRRIDVSLYKISEVIGKFRYCETADENNMTMDEYHKLNQLFSDVERYLIDLEGWDIILGSEVDEDNIKQLGKERFMAEILWSMTYYGYDEQSISRKRAEYERSNEESGEDRISFDGMAELLFGEGFSLSEGEEEINKENAANMLCSYKTLKAFYEKRKK